MSNPIFNPAAAPAPATNTGKGRQDRGEGVYVNIGFEVAPGHVIQAQFGLELNERVNKTADQKKLTELLLAKLADLPAGEQQITLQCPIHAVVRPNENSKKEVQVESADWTL